MRGSMIRSLLLVAASFGLLAAADAAQVALISFADGSLDTYSSILVDGERCRFGTFEPTEAPKGDRAAR
jgi:hypothetical protein